MGSPPTSPADAPASSPHGSRPASPAGAPHETLSLRALVSTKDAGVIIGKAGKNVADLRDQTGVKAGVSKVVPGVHERVLTVTGPVEGVAKAYKLIITQLLAASPASPSGAPPPTPSSHTVIRLLISHNLMGTIIGRNGLKIKAIQDASGARMVAQKDMLPQSTERIVEVQGSADAIGRAIEEIGKCLLEDYERGTGTVLFHPGTETSSSSASGRRNSLAYTATSDGHRGAGSRRGTLNGDNSTRERRAGSPPPSPPQTSAPGTPASPPMASNLRTQNISIPSDMVGCIIGRQGSKITEIRRLSGSKISIAKTPHDDTGERMFTIIGTPEANEKALFLLYNQLESEKERRVGREQQNQEE